MTRSLACLGTLVLLAATVPAADSPEPRGQAPSAEALLKWSRAENLVVVDLTAVAAGPTGLSFPPLHNSRLSMTVRESIRGTLKPGATVLGLHTVRQQERPEFPQGKRCLASLTAARGGYRVEAIEEASDAAIKQARLVAELPLGWRVEGKTFVSPWAALGKQAWPATLKSSETMRCGRTGRPALLVGAGLTLTVEPVPPAKAIQFQNPDGDGEYRLTLKNTSADKRTVPALLRDGERVLWEECAVVLCQNKVYPLPGAKGVPEAARAVVLGPGEGVSTVVQALRLQGPEWPRGGYRIEFTFALGEKGVTQSFYYFSRHHDAIRGKLGVR